MKQYYMYNGKEETSIFKEESCNESDSAAGESSSRESKTSVKRERKMIESSHVSGDSVVNRLKNKIDSVYRTIKEIKDEMVGKNIIRQTIDEEMDRVKLELQNWKKSELELMISKKVTKEVQKITSIIPTPSPECRARNYKRKKLQSGCKKMNRNL